MITATAEVAPWMSWKMSCELADQFSPLPEKNEKQR